MEMEKVKKFIRIMNECARLGVRVRSSRVKGGIEQVTA